MREWNQCVYCGQFIAYQEFADGAAVNNVEVVAHYSMSGEAEPEYHQAAWHKRCAPEQETDDGCKHQWVDPSNEMVKANDHEICLDCGLIRRTAADQEAA